MKKKNKVLLVLVGVLLLTIGGSLAYFVARSTFSGTGGKVVATTTTISGATLKVEGTLEFNDTDVYPGHTVVSGIKVTATGDNKLIPYNLVWNGLSEISGLNFKVYKTSSTVDVTSSCEKKMETVSGMQQYFEECEINNLDKLGTEIATGSINKNDTKVILVKDEFITATSDGQVVYYYIILEYPNLDMNQKDDINATFEGKVTVEESNKKPDINILAVKLEQEDGTYQDSDDIPQEGYILNQEKSTCSNGASVRWDIKNKELITSNLTKNGTSCYLTFDKYIPTAFETLIASFESYDGYKGATSPDFTKTATEAENKANNGIFVTDDPMYGTGRKTYYWRGAATTNHVIFDNKCWRIVRINGDESIRLIYNGTVQSGNTCKGNGLNSDSVVLSGTLYNDSWNNSSYVGWTYTYNNQRPSNTSLQTSGTSALLKTSLETWYNNNIAEKSKVVKGNFCNDRNTQNNETWRPTGSTQYYATHQRLTSGTKAPQLSCPDGDVYSLDIGMITIDEVQFAGASGTTINQSYYLYNGQYYWTMSPDQFNGGNAYVFVVDRDEGSFHGVSVYSTASARPVINLRSDVTFNVGSDGTQNNPYIVQ